MFGQYTSNRLDFGNYRWAASPKQTSSQFILKDFTSAAVSPMTWGGLTAICVRPYAENCQPPTCMNCMKGSNAHNPQHTILPANTAKFICWIAGGVGVIIKSLIHHVWITVGVEIFPHSSSLSLSLRGDWSTVCLCQYTVLVQCFNSSSSTAMVFLPDHYCVARTSNTTILSCRLASAPDSEATI